MFELTSDYTFYYVDPSGTLIDRLPFKATFVETPGTRFERCFFTCHHVESELFLNFSQNDKNCSGSNHGMQRTFDGNIRVCNGQSFLDVVRPTFTKIQGLDASFFIPNAITGGWKPKKLFNLNRFEHPLRIFPKAPEWLQRVPGLSCGDLETNMRVISETSNDSAVGMSGSPLVFLPDNSVVGMLVAQRQRDDMTYERFFHLFTDILDSLNSQIRILHA